MTEPVPPAALPTASRSEARARIRRLLRERWAGVTVAVFLTSASTACSLAGPALVGIVVGVVTRGASDAGSVVTRAAAAYAVLAVLAAVLRYAGGVRAAVVGEDALAELRTEVFDHALAVPVDVVERAGTGDLVSRVTSDVTILADAVRNAIPVSVIAMLELAFTMGALLLLDVRLAGTAIVTGIPIAALGARWYLRRAPALYRRERECHAALAAGLHEAYIGAAVLTGYRAAPRTRMGLARRGRQTVDSEMATTAARNRMRPMISLGQAVSLVAVMALGATLVSRGSLGIGTLSAAALYLIQLFSPIGVLLEWTDELQRSTASFARLVGVTSLPVERRATLPTSGDARLPAPAARRARSVRIRDVRFAYEAGAPAVDGVSVEVEPGERMAIVGPSGAGKTTLGKIVAGLLQPDRGSVSIGDAEVTDLDSRSRAQLVAMVAQEVHVFGRTVADNVRLGDDRIDDDEVRRALAAVDALEWAESLRDGIDTWLGSGHPVSTTRAQQLALARLVCLDPAVVVLDEATADLDPIAAARTERHLDAAIGDRTVITIVHRLDAAERADRVLVLDAGRVVACGCHEELITDAGSPYTRLWEAWLASRELLPARPQGEAGVRTSSC